MSLILFLITTNASGFTKSSPLYGDMLNSFRDEATSFMIYRHKFAYGACSVVSSYWELLTLLSLPTISIVVTQKIPETLEIAWKRESAS